jgi:hypothetical protein
MKWEYATQPLYVDLNEQNRQLREIGNEGWELVSVVHWPTGGGMVGYFKRPYVEHPPTLRVVPKDGA